MGTGSVIHGTLRGVTTGAWPESLRRILFRRLWVPRFAYEAIPFLYLAAGGVALWSAIRLPGWTWILPYVALFGLACLHAGIALVALRYRFRRQQARRSP
jgi:hypothetical protein